MAEYIDREAFIEAVKDIPMWGSVAVMFADSIPAADVAPVGHGRWETEIDDMGWLKHTCPICGYVKRTDIHVSLGWHYCPKCGAKMDGGLI